jgi:hypothetical protein
VIAKKLSVWLVAGMPLIYAACGGEGLTLPGEGDPAHIVLLDGNGQTARVGDRLNLPLLVKVTDSQDRPVEGAMVDFTFDDPSAAGEASPSSNRTDANGETSSMIRLGTRVGPVNGHATVQVPEGALPVTVPFTATAFSADAAGIALVSGDDQEAAVGTALIHPLVVRVTDNFGNPIPNITVEWVVTGGGEVSQTSTVTDAAGLASVVRTLGSTAGDQTTEARAGGLVGSPVVFSHVATAGAAARIIKESGDGQNGTAGAPLPNPLVVQVLDEANNPIAGRAVTWVVGNGGGSVSPQNSTTDGQGRASTQWTLGTAGNNTVNAVVSGMTPATFSATAAAGGVSASRSRVTVGPQSVHINETSTIMVRVRDGSGSAVGGVVVTVSSTGTGNEISPASSTSSEDGLAFFSFRSTVAEAKTITAVAGGVTLNDKPVITVGSLETTTEITGHTPEQSTSGQPVHVTFTVTGEGGGTPSGDVTVFSDRESAVCSAPVAQGFCDITLTVAGNHELTAAYSGDAQFEESSDEVDHLVLPAAPTNNAPTPQPDQYDTPGGGQSLTVSAPGVLANDSDPDGNALSAQNASNPSKGSVSLNSDGMFNYTPHLGASGPDSFTYEASDGSSTTQATVTINIVP